MAHRSLPDTGRKWSAKSMSDAVMPLMPPARPLDLMPEGENWEEGEWIKDSMHFEGIWIAHARIQAHSLPACRCGSFPATVERRVRGAFTLKIIVTKFKGLNHLTYWSNWGYMKALSILLQISHGSLLWSRKWLCDNPKCWAHLLDLSATQKYACKIYFYYKIVQNFFISR